MTRLFGEVDFGSIPRLGKPSTLCSRETVTRGNVTLCYFITLLPTFGHCDRNSYQATRSTNGKAFPKDTSGNFLVSKNIPVLRKYIYMRIFWIDARLSWLNSVFSIVFYRNNIHLLARKVIYQPIKFFGEKTSEMCIHVVSFLLLLVFPLHLKTRNFFICDWQFWNSYANDVLFRHFQIYLNFFVILETKW